MTHEEIIEFLDAMARQSDDGAMSGEVVSEAFKPIFEAVFAQPPSQDNTDRMMELQHYTFHQQAEAKRLRKEAEKFRKVAVEVRRMATHIRRHPM